MIIAALREITLWLFDA